MTNGRWLPWLVLWLSLLFLVPLVMAQSPPDVPDAAVGADIFAERCANCHGPAGAGDGEMAANLPNPPIDFTNPAWRRTAVPADLFETITNGRVQNGMPPFGPETSNPLSEVERQHLIATLFSLSTPAEAMAQGEIGYEANCLACHGVEGSAVATADLTDPGYWFSRSNEDLFTLLTGDAIAEHTYDLSADEVWAILDYARTFSYLYFNPAAPLPPIEAGTISGTVFNGTTNEIVGEGTALLRAFTRELEEPLSLTAEIDANGRYQFDVALVPPDWIYLVAVEHKGFRFLSDFNQLSHQTPTLDLPVIVYEPTTDASAVTVEQVHILLNFLPDSVEVNELYTFSNGQAAVFVGETGEPEAGTVQINVPTGAQKVAFQRSVGGLDSFAPAQEVIRTETGWADTLPLQPGRGSLNLLVRYELPFQEGMTIAHPLAYDAANITAIVPDVGITLDEANWTPEGSQQMSSGVFTGYSHPPTAAGEALRLQLNGRLQQAFDTSGNAVLVRDETTELMIGGGALIIVLAAAAYLVRSWQTAVIVASDDGDTRLLLQDIADLDEAYEAQQINDRQYTRQRQKLKEQLMAIWEDEY